MSTHKAPNEKRAAGEVYRHEKAALHERNKKKAAEYSSKIKRICHIVKDIHTGIERKVYQIVK